MNILPKKSWHVLSKDNIQRVRQDEAAAKAEEEEKQQRASLAEREAQLTLMRKRAREREGISEEQRTSISSQNDRHINFFSDIQQGVGVQLANKDHEQEVAQEKESYEKKIGLLNYLVDKSKSDDPWYITHKKTEESKKSHHRKEAMDPLNDMKKHLGEKRKISEKALSESAVQEKRKCLEAPPSQSYAQREPAREASRVEHPHRTKSSSHHKHSHKKHKKHKSEKKDEETEARLEKLRKERLKREEAEKIKSEALMKRHYGVSQETSSVDPSEEQTVRPRKYNSQFNPSLARY